MAKKAQTVYVCNECGYESPKWMGQCICGAWNSFAEERLTPSSEGKAQRGLPKAKKPISLTAVDSVERDRIDTGIGELNRVLGGGIVRGSLTLMSGEPGIGKSTLILQTAAAVAVASAEAGGRVLYVTGEESEAQIRMRADRLEGDLSENLMVLSETCMENITATTEDLQPVLLIIDSIQTMYTDALDSAPGSVSQVRACTSDLMRTAKALDIPIFIVAHVTKTGELAGPKIIEHLVDAVLLITGERDHDLRILRSNKNRFGTTSEIGAFEMSGSGLAEVTDISGSLLGGVGRTGSSEGAACAAVCEGNRSLLFEIQALAAPTGQNFPRRTPVGVDLARMNMIIAVLERKAKIYLSNKDIYVNVAGGLKPDGTSADLAVALAIASSAESFPIRSGLLAAGEVGLTGELRPIRGAEKIVREAEKLGFFAIILPKKNAESLPKIPGIAIIPADSIETALDAIRNTGAPPTSPQ